MGQYWKFVNIDKRQDTGHLGKMGEFFFSQEPIKLMYLLALPVAPLKNASSHPAAQELAGSWAGDRIICLGDYADSWPKGKVSVEDFQTSEEATEGNPEEDRNTSGSYEADKAGLKSPGNFMESCRRVARVDFGDEKGVAYPLDRVWVLRNLTKKIYVRSNGIPAAGRGRTLSYDHQKGFAGYPGLSNVLVANIGWSDDPSTSMCYSRAGSLIRGKWAGDRIDVRLLDDVEQDMIDGGWVDESRGQAKKLYNIWMEDGDGDGRGEFPEEPERHQAIE